MSSISRTYASVFFALLLSACGAGGSVAGGGNAGSAGLLPRSIAASNTPVPITVSLVLPTAAQSRFINPYTSAKLTITPTSGTPIVLSSNCTVVCSFTPQVAPGTLSMNFQLYQWWGDAGAMFYNQSVPVTISANQPNKFSFITAGNVAALSLAVAQPTFTYGSAATSSVQVIPLDASGNQIIGTQTFASPISVSIANNTASEFSLSNTSITSPAAGSVTLSFNGGTITSQASIVASVANSTITTSTNLITQGNITLPNEPTVAASIFTNSIGVNTHFEYPSYINAESSIIPLLTASGIKHIRDRFDSNPPNAPYFNTLQQLENAGIHGTLLTQINMPVSTILANVNGVPGFAEAIEAPNEYNLSGDPNWAANLAAYQQTLYTGVKATPQLANLTVIGPSLTFAYAYANVGDLSSYLDAGNTHYYFGGYNPGTGPYGGPGFGTAYGTILYSMRAAAQTSGSKPIIATETGYCNAPNTVGAIPATIGSKYIPRTFLEEWRNGVIRTIEYEFIDEGGTGCEGSYGLVDASMHPKPGYYALQSFLTTLSDTGTGGPAASLPMSITAGATTVHHQLFQKSNGMYVLALWNEVSSWTSTSANGPAITTPPTSVYLQLAHSPTSSSISTIGDSGSLQSSSLQWNNGQTNFTIDDHVTLLTFAP